MGIIEHRRALHQIPELDRVLPLTAAYLNTALERLPCRVFSPTEGSLCAFFDFGKPETLAFRSDMDALPIGEKTGLAFTSRHPGVMHACGHDGHMAILLELARRMGQKESLHHNILLIFQCAEETTGGARDICQAGVLDDYHVKAVFGLHLWPGLAAGQVFSRPGPMMSGACEVTVEVSGRSAHIAKAQEGVDAMAAAVEIYQKAVRLDGNGVLLKFGKFQSGTARNAISAYSRLEGSLRSFSSEAMDRAKEQLQEICQNAKLTFGQGNPPLCNDGALLESVQKLVGVQTLKEPVMTTEDFAVYQQYRPGVFFFLGLGDVPPLHSDVFDFDEEILTKGADLFQKLAEELL